MSYKIFFEGPDLNPSQEKGYYHHLGSSPDLADRLHTFLLRYKNEASELHICLYLFNNTHIADAVIELANHGVNVFITTIPLEGYTKKMVTVTDGIHCRKTSKFLEAEKVHQRLLNTPNIHLKYFDHIFVRSAKFSNFSRGALPYSLHIKSMLLITDQRQYKILTSSNLAIGDELKDELILIECIPTDDQCNLNFFHHIHQLATINPALATELSFSYRNKPYDKLNRRIFTSPFYQNSNNHVDKRIKNLIRTAKVRLIICAQHVTNFTDEIRTALRANNQLRVTVISQTYAGDSDIYHRVRHPQNENDFRRFSAALSQQNVSHFVNGSVHHKFIVVDDVSLISTANYTNTQALWKPINIAQFTFAPERSYCGVFSEINEYTFISCQATANQLDEHARLITLKDGTYKA